MRIIAGELKGRTLDAPDWPGLRPTSDKLRGTLFNILAPRIRGARLLDGYAGSGAVGLEALSRGAAQVAFVEQDPRALRLIAANLARCGVTDRYAIIPVGFAGIDRRVGRGDFDLVFLDPPYGAAEVAAALAAAGPLVGPDALLVIEHARRDASPLQAGGSPETVSWNRGDSALSFYVAAGAQSSSMRALDDMPEGPGPQGL